MKTKFLSLVLLSLAMCTFVKAQEKAGSIVMGFSPLGNISEKISLDSEKYKYHYKSYWNANIGYEKQFAGMLWLEELAYSKGNFDEYELEGTSQWFNPAQSKDIYAVSLTHYFGKTINPSRRIQFPLYIGIGADYINGGPFHNLTIDGALKGRVKFYITNNFGIYAGVTGRYGWGSKRATESNSSSSGRHYNITSLLWALDAGFILTIK